MLTLLIPVLFIAVIYFFMIRPQQQQARQHQDLVAALEEGDEVLTSAGIYGTITAIDDDTIEVEVAEGVVVTMSRQAVVEVAVEVDDEDDDAAGSDDEESDVDVDGR
jgi:preprotein translocase subunit YajC